MYYVYVLRSTVANRFYIGSSATPEERLRAHNAGRSRWTSRFRPWERILLEEYVVRAKAEKREHYLKSGWGRRWLKKKLDVEGCQSG